MKQAYVLGIDGGGTKCAGTLFNDAGQALAQAETGPANIFRDLAQAKASILALAENISAQTSIPLDNFELSLGCAGAGVHGAAEALLEWKHPFKSMAVTSDLHIACLAANKGKECGLLITGTGSALAHYRLSGLKSFGGYGASLGDQAGGAYIGKRALQSLLMQVDGIAADDDYIRSMLTFLDCVSANQIVSRYQNAQPSDFGAIAPHLIGLLRSGNLTAQAIFDEQIEYLRNLINATDIPANIPIFMSGGLAPIYLPYLRERVSHHLSISEQRAEYGAYLYIHQEIQE